MSNFNRKDFFKELHDQRKTETRWKVDEAIKGFQKQIKPLILIV
ncbi:hypothetical protein [Caloranaerobacter ferrireducens]|nr:hypothetical protein [Caloranaerobacter ferrireducens]